MFFFDLGVNKILVGRAESALNRKTLLQPMTGRRSLDREDFVRAQIYFFFSRFAVTHSSHSFPKPS